ncbi:MAG: hypothetical protein V4514_23230 [Pseudomonadota bacterium]|uniref:hypothetical protein n=1 Tax=Phenylobacterium sp. TaxID=1871053 RepID=UPI0025E8768F|nr:hypothetical protein [Phenylobacterium sp.]MBT9472516.1 hypothetical protein [Phenylobacterium sp.]
MSALFLALALFAQDPVAAGASEPAPQAAEPPYPPGAPHDDYGLVSWCHGALTGYLDLHDRVMPEVTRIETTYRAPGSSLKEDLKVYADMQKQSRQDLKLFARAMEAAERASIKPINTLGGAAVQRGRSGWAAAANLPKARVAQEWMSWSLPARCVPTATRLEKQAKLLGAAFDPGVEALPADSGVTAAAETPANP